MEWRHGGGASATPLWRLSKSSAPPPPPPSWRSGGPPRAPRPWGARRTGSSWCRSPGAPRGCRPRASRPRSALPRCAHCTLRLCNGECARRGTCTLRGRACQDGARNRPASRPSRWHLGTPGPPIRPPARTAPPCRSAGTRTPSSPPWPRCRRPASRPRSGPGRTRGCTRRPCTPARARRASCSRPGRQRLCAGRSAPARRPRGCRPGRLGSRPRRRR
mmetsp:Transcript_91007/g.266474  ORF Transcript_91007/g.266474 Transcript_91007/m.266474 type:complete len:218 (-) Transcript_91007:392-1045(-)